MGVCGWDEPPPSTGDMPPRQTSPGSHPTPFERLQPPHRSPKAIASSRTPPTPSAATRSSWPPTSTIPQIPASSATACASSSAPHDAWPPPGPAHGWRQHDHLRAPSRSNPSHHQRNRRGTGTHFRKETATRAAYPGTPRRGRPDHRPGCELIDPALNISRRGPG